MRINHNFWYMKNIFKKSLISANCLDKFLVYVFPTYNKRKLRLSTILNKFNNLICQKWVLEYFMNISMDIFVLLYVKLITYKTVKIMLCNTEDYSVLYNFVYAEWHTREPLGLRELCH